MWSDLGENVVGLREDSVAAVEEKGSMEDLRGGIRGRMGLAEVADGVMCRGIEPEPV